MTALSRSSLFSIAALLIGFLAWSGSPKLLVLTLGIPFLLGLAQSARDSALIAVGYFGAAWAPVIAGAHVFFPRSPWVAAILLWVIPTLLVGCLFGWLFRFGTMGLLFALLVQGLSYVGLASPLSVAGVVFPGFGLFGFFLTLCLFWAMLARRPAAIAPLWVVALVLNARYMPPEQPVGWQAVSTQFGKPDPIAGWGHVAAILFEAATSNARVLVLPESIAQEALPNSIDFFAPSLRVLQAEHKTVLMGVDVRVGSQQWENRYIALGGAAEIYRQRVPIPVAMWGNGYAAAPLSSSVLSIDGKRASILLCYEQLLPLTELLSLVAKPDVLLAPSNLYWAPSRVAAAESATVQSWARLQHIPVLQAVNR
jgi:hypothetical protein